MFKINIDSIIVFLKSLKKTLVKKQRKMFLNIELNVVDSKKKVSHLVEQLENFQIYIRNHL